MTTRRGDGYHELDTIFALLDLHDDLEGEPAGEFTLEVAGMAVSSGEDNLILRAARAFSRAAGTGAASFRLHKRIPVSAGLGGGSADAAAALRLMARFYPAATVDLPGMALGIGADVPFLLSGQAAAWGRGRGERLQEIAIPERHLVLANPGVPVGAGDAFAWLQNYSRRLDRPAILAELASGTPRWINALQTGVTREVPAVRQVIQVLRQAGLASVLMSGSGATCFGLAENEEAATEAAALIQAGNPDWWVRADRVGG